MTEVPGIPPTKGIPPDPGRIVVAPAGAIPVLVGDIAIVMCLLLFWSKVGNTDVAGVNCLPPAGELNLLLVVIIGPRPPIPGETIPFKPPIPGDSIEGNI